MFTNQATRILGEEAIAMQNMDDYIDDQIAVLNRVADDAMHERWGRAYLGLSRTIENLEYVKKYVWQRHVESDG